VRSAKYALELEPYAIFVECNCRMVAGTARTDISIDTDSDSDIKEYNRRYLTGPGLLLLFFRKMVHLSLR